MERIGWCVQRGPGLAVQVAARKVPVLFFSILIAISFGTFTSGVNAADFDTTIRPLLQQHCIVCHGGDEQNGELRLDAKVFAFQGGYDGPAVVAGQPGRSPLFQRITSTDDDRMPPPDHTAEPLNRQEIAAVKAWIEAGAVWPENAVDRAAMSTIATAGDSDRGGQHWSIQPIRSDFPGDASIDQFIEAKLRENGLAMSPPADARTLTRRLHFDLIGLPPTSLASSDPMPDREYRSLVDRLLASPHHGQRWARHWLDIAHYADTHGFERDQLRPNAWRYRDYVIRSLNADKPYDRFLREQIAGDMLTPDSSDALAALGFLAAGPWDFVGHVETKSDVLRRAARAGDLDDMVTQVMTATMGLTVNCARCHDHKIDPISQREYYKLWAVFAGVKRGEREADPGEAKRITDERDRLRQSLAEILVRITKLSGDRIELAKLLPANSGIDLRNGTISQEMLGYHRDLEPNRLQQVEGVAGVKWVFIPDGSGTVIVDIDKPVEGVPPTSGHFWDTVANRSLNAQRTTTLGDTDYAQADQTLLAMHANSGITFDLEALREISGMTAMRLTGLVGFGAAEAAAASHADFTAFVDRDLKFQRLKLRKDETVSIDVDVPATAATLTLIATDGGDGISNDLLFIGNPQLVADDAEQLPSADVAELARLRQEAERCEQELQALPEPSKLYAIVSDPHPPVVRVQRRGDPEKEGPPVTPGAVAWAQHAPAEFGDHQSSEGQRRLALANWITHPDNPLTARVIVNRLWHHHFGQGLVTTPSDFGRGGDTPSHPELLDFLARELIDNGWSLKHIHRLIVCSRTYRQASFGRSDSQQASRVDAANRLLWRQNPRRLDAETLRDTVLAVSGKLNHEHGGPGFRDFDYTEAYAPIYRYITADRPELWRRSIYRFVVRTTPQPLMTTLDCPDPANLTPVRSQTTTALQALALSNNEFMLQQARYMAARIEAEGESRKTAVVRAFELAFQRPPNDTELNAAMNLAAEQGLFSLCRALLNANEFLYID